MICETCHNNFNQQKTSQIFCSTKCRNRVNRRKHLAKNRKPSRSVKNMTIAEYCEARTNKLKRDVKKDSFRYFASAWNPELKGLPCEHCGYSKHTEFAHIKGVAEFPDTALLREVHARSNIKILCPNCHWEFDNLPRTGQFYES